MQVLAKAFNAVWRPHARMHARVCELVRTKAHVRVRVRACVLIMRCAFACASAEPVQVAQPETTTSMQPSLTEYVC